MGAATGSRSERRVLHGQTSSRSSVRLSLRMRLALWAALATGLATLLVAAGLYFAVSGLIQRSQTDQALSAARTVQERLDTLIRDRRANPFDAQAFVLGQVELTDADLRRLADVGGPRLGTEIRLLDPASRQARSTPRFPAQVPVALAPGRPYRLGDQIVVTQPVPSAQLLLTVVTDARAVVEAQQAFVRAMTVLLPLSLLLALAVGWLVAGRLLRPVQALEGAARHIGSGGDLRRPLPGAGDQDELARLAQTLQRSFGQLADARDREQAFLRAAAHDLRSPLAALQARVQGSLTRDRTSERYRQDLHEIGQDITRLSTLANHLLLLARDPSAVAQADVPLRDLAADAVDRARELAPEADVDLLAPTPVTVTGDRVLLGQAIWNLTMNAVHHAPGATVQVSVTGDQSAATIRIHDTGPGVAPEALARLGEAFYRPDHSRTGDGHGLGLALARRAAELHGGRLELRSAPGQGFEASLVLPRRPPLLP